MGDYRDSAHRACMVGVLTEGAARNNLRIESFAVWGPGI